MEVDVVGAEAGRLDEVAQLPRAPVQRADAPFLQGSRCPGLIWGQGGYGEEGGGHGGLAEAALGPVGGVEEEHALLQVSHALQALQFPVNFMLHDERLWIS